MITRGHVIDTRLQCTANHALVPSSGFQILGSAASYNDSASFNFELSQMEL
jgi:hypothetical protein